MHNRNFSLDDRVVTFLLLILVFFSAVPAQWVQAAEWTTTDDPRRVPLPAPNNASKPLLMLKGGTLIDGTGDRPVHNATIVIQGDRLLKVGPADEIQLDTAADRVIDIDGLYVIPGLIDLHLHFTQQRGKDFSRYRDSDAAATVRGTLLLEQLINAGITAVRDVGTRNDVAYQLKQAVERKMLAGPRVFWSGQLIVARGGHADEITSTATGRPRSLATKSRVRVATGPWGWRQAVREQIRMHADWIKLTAPYTKEEVKAAVDEAHMWGIPVAVDAFGKYIDWAAEAGVDSIEHPLNMSEQTIKIMKRHKTDFVPTLTAFYNPTKKGYPSAGVPAGGFFHTFSRRFPVVHEQHLEVVAWANKAGLQIGVGTDIPFMNDVRYPEDYYSELGFLKEAGLSDTEVFYSATRIGAEILKMGDKLGTLETGKLADILVVGANPLLDIQNVRDVRLVIADGRVVSNKLQR